MARFYGPVGYVKSVETAPGVWEDSVTEHNSGGDVLRSGRRLNSGENLNDNLSAVNTFSLLIDGYATENLFAIRYIKWMGSYWKVSTVEIQVPRLLLTIGEVYNGPKA